MAGAVAFAAYVTDRETLDAAVAGTVEAFGGIDVVLANAGIAPSGPVPGALALDVARSRSQARGCRTRWL